MISLTNETDWTNIKGKLKQKYAQLTDNDLAYVKGREDEMLDAVERKTGVAREELERILSADPAPLVADAAN